MKLMISSIVTLFIWSVRFIVIARLIIEIILNPDHLMRRYFPRSTLISTRETFGRARKISETRHEPRFRLLKTKRESRMDSRAGWKMSRGTIRNRRNELNARERGAGAFPSGQWPLPRRSRGIREKKEKKAIHGDGYLPLIKREPCRYRERSDRVNHRLEGNLLRT